MSCPCGAAADFGEHCEPLLDGVPAATAESLMRSRYTAYVRLQQDDARAADHLWRSWHPRTRPATVEFVARWESGQGRHRQSGEIHERSEFARRGGRWVYVRGDDLA